MQKSQRLIKCRIQISAFIYCHMKRIFTLLLLLSAALCHAQVQPIQHGHSHNDYKQNRPLFEALDNGFTSIEIDVFLHNNQLIVSHDCTGLDKKPSIEGLYLDSILARIDRNGGIMYKGYSTPVIIMVELKTSAKEGYAKLKEVLAKYKDILAVYKKDAIVKPGPIHILITGHQPYESLLKEESSFATIDAGMDKMDDAKYDPVVTRYSDPWNCHFKWKGKGTMPQKEHDKLLALVAKAHKKGKDIRFFGIPDNANVWKVLLEAKVDWVNTDKLAKYSKFYRQTAK